MNVYISWVSRTSITVPRGTIVSGHPLDVYFTRWQYIPKKLTSWFDIFCVCAFGCVFALNIALNNVSLAYISIAVNLIIRSCLPLTTFLSQQGLAVFKLYPFKPCRFKEISLMVVGVICAAVFTMAQIMASANTGHKKEAGNQIL